MKVGLIGSGSVGRTLGTAFLNEGYEVMLGTRDTRKEEVVKWQQENPSAKTGNFEETAKFGELLVLAVNGSAALDAVRLAGISNFSRKTVIDTTNPIDASPPDNGVLRFFTGPNESLVEMIQQLLPEAKLVKAFNSVGNDFMYQPAFPQGTPTMFICGNDESAKKQVTGILTSFGWETEDMGKVEAGRAIEPLSVLWCIPGFIHNRWTHAFKLLKM